MPRRERKGIRIGRHRVRALAGARNRKKHPLKLFSIILIPAIKPGSAKGQKKRHYLYTNKKICKQLTNITTSGRGGCSGDQWQAKRVRTTRAVVRSSTRAIISRMMERGAGGQLLVARFVLKVTFYIFNIYVDSDKIN